jgi:HEAT repeat protein
MSTRDNFSPATKETLAKRVGWRCSNPGCRQLTSGPHEEDTKSVNIGVAAHITAAASGVGAKRYNPNLSTEERKAITNGIWLCQNCGKLVDSDEQKYSVELLINWKRDAEDRAASEVETMTPQVTSNHPFVSYLQNLVDTPRISWLDEFVDLTGSEFELFAKVQEKLEKSEREEPNKLPIPLLTAIHDSDQRAILITGDPGAGKSTFLESLSIEAARQALIDPNMPIPVLVSLKDYDSLGQFSGIRGLIYSTLEGYVDTEAVNQLLSNKKILLLIDGWNELSDEKAKSKVKKFCQPHSVIVTSRSSGDYWEIQQKFEIQPLSPTDVRDFFDKRLPNIERQRLQELVDRVRDFGQTPLIVWMLLIISHNNSQIPKTRGEAYRSFTATYEKKAKECVDLESSRKLLGKLAFEMMKSQDSEDSTEFRLNVSEVEAEEILGAEEFNRMLNHLLKQQGNMGIREISFCHQSIQEYYAAEHLRRELDLHPEWLERQDGDNYSWFQYHYLNYTKWTESIALLLGFPEVSQKLALKLTESALGVDLMLGARLAGEVRSAFQRKAISMISEQNIPDIPEWFRVFLLGKTRSKEAVDELIKIIKNPDPAIRRKAVWASRELNRECIIPIINAAIKDPDSQVRETAIRVVSEVDIDWSVSIAEEIISKEIVASVREVVVNFILGKSNSDTSILLLVQAKQDKENNVRVMAEYYLKSIGTDVLINSLSKALDSGKNNTYLRKIIIGTLGDLGDASVLPNLFKAQLDLNLGIYHEATWALQKIMGRVNKREDDLENCRKKQLQHQIDEWFVHLKSDSPIPRGNAVLGLKNLPDKEIATKIMFQSLNDSHHYVRGHAIHGLAELTGKESISELIKALNDQHCDVRGQASQELVNFKQVFPNGLQISEDTILRLIKVLEEEKDAYIRSRTLRTLTDLCSIFSNLPMGEKIEDIFLYASDDPDRDLRCNAAQGLRNFYSEKVVAKLFQMLNDTGCDLY